MNTTAVAENAADMASPTIGNSATKLLTWRGRRMPLFTEQAGFAACLFHGKLHAGCALFYGLGCTIKSLLSIWLHLSEFGVKLLAITNEFQHCVTYFDCHTNLPKN